MAAAVIDKYLRNRAAHTPWLLEGCDTRDFRAAVVLPALAEEESLPQTLAALAQNPAILLDGLLVVVVVNNRSDATTKEKAENRRTLDWLATNPYPQLHLSWIDVASPGLELPPKDGVGLARKIGFDLALPLLDWEKAPLLISLDADTLVDDNYLPAIFAHFESSNRGGATLPFRHQPGKTEVQETAIRHYELYLRSYLHGLQFAGSPYAYHAIGSAIACRATAYVAVGGMNRRAAGEDFYFLQQLTKTSGVEMLRGTLVRPSARTSQRVPFGTGRAVQASAAESKALYRFISLRAFEILRDWLSLVSENCDRSGETLLAQAFDLSPVLGEFLETRDFVACWRKIKRNNPPTRLVPAWHNWFDGLRTRQLLHRLMENLPAREPEELVEELLAAGGWCGRKDRTDQLALLEELQG